MYGFVNKSGNIVVYTYARRKTTEENKKKINIEIQKEVCVHSLQMR